MRIPRIIHQLWKDENIPERWREAVASVRKHHKGWEYRLWTDDMIDRHVQERHPDLYPVFRDMERQIMRVDVFRYVLMHDIGGLYCDLDYEFLRPFDYGDSEVVLSLEYDQAFGDDENQIANYVFASVPGHALWKDILTDVQTNPPHAPSAHDVCIVTGPQLVTRIFFRNQALYQGVQATSQPVLSPRRVHGRYERKHYLNAGITYGFHYGWGSWRERWNAQHVKRRLAKVAALLGLRRRRVT